MRHFMLTTEYPLHFSTCGQLVSRDGFLHHKRCFDQHVLILVTEGILHITAAGVSHAIGPDQYIFLKAGEEHFGHCPSSGNLSYLWVHLTADPDFQVLTGCHDASLPPVFHRNDPALGNQTGYGDASIQTPFHSKGAERQTNCDTAHNHYYFAEEGRSAASKRFPLLFHQLLDFSMEDTSYMPAMPDYALSLMMMELSREQFCMQQARSRQIPPVISLICEWVKANYHRDFSVKDLACEFGYQADYLSGLFKQHMGISLTRYTTSIRIEVSKNLLANYGLSIKEAAYSCGFSDEKYYMKVFKRSEGMTPTQYKSAFYKKYLN